MTYNSSPKSHSLRTSPDRIRSILDIGTDDILARLGEDASADSEFGVGAFVIDQLT